MDVCESAWEVEYEPVSEKSEQNRVRRDVRLYGTVQALL